MTVPVGRNDTQQAREAFAKWANTPHMHLGFSERQLQAQAVLAELADANDVADRYERYDVWQGLAAENARLEAERDTLAEAFRNETLISNEYAARTRIAWELLDDAIAVESTSMAWRERANRERPRGRAAIDTAALAAGRAGTP